MTDFEDDDIEWEDEEILLADEEDLEIELDSGGVPDGGRGKDGPASKKAKRNPVHYTPEECEQARRRFTNHLDRESSQAVSMSQGCNEFETGALLISLLPKPIMTKCSLYPQASIIEQKATLVQLLDFIKLKFTEGTEDDVSIVDRVDHEYLATLFARASEDAAVAVSRKQLCVILVTCLRTFGILARLVGCFDPPSAHPLRHRDLYEAAWRRQQAGEQGVPAGTLDFTQEMERWRKKVPSKRDALLCTTWWVEAYLGKHPAGAGEGTGTGGNIKTKADLSPVKGGGNAAEPICLDDSDDDDMPNRIPNSSSNSGGSKSSNVTISSSSSSSTEEKWICVDIARRVGPVKSRCCVDEPELVEGVLRRGQPVVYVMAVENIGVCADVSARYALQPVKSEKKTHPVLKMWWLQKIRQKSTVLPDLVHIGGEDPNDDSWGLTGPATSATGSDLSSSELLAAVNRQQRELHQLSAAHANAPVPTTLSGFKKHPKFILERDFLSNHGIRPGSKSQGMFKGSRYWLKKDVSTLLPIRKWGGLMRCLKPGEHDTPAKTLTRKTTKDKQQTSYQVYLYGEWQTQPLVIAPIVNDIIPTNEYGKMEVWDNNEKLIPQGAVYFRYTEYPATVIRSACKVLDANAVEALVGFEHKAGGLTVPKIGGVVVLRRQAEAVRLKCDEILAIKAVEQVKEREKRAIGNWGVLVHSALVRQSIRNRFGH